ncbi:MAG TPA: M56 family metallopeptidase [Planctomycetaceae bacterium]|jgi:beta-lactamase regulating signal transducer with metallopeptidase domain|nr:M56 family metallopeptidase [Planctomycetaceae bacterium]
MHRLANEWVTLGWTQLWQVTLLAVAVYVATRIFGRHRPHVGYVLWMLVIVKCLTPPIWASPVGFFSLAQSPRGAVPAPPARETGSDGPDAAEMTSESPIVAQRSSASTGRVEIKPADGARPAIRFGLASNAIQVLAGIWLAGFLAVTMAIVSKWGAFRRQIGKMGSAASAEIEQRIQKLAERLSVRQVPLVVMIEGPSVPAVFGILRPKVLLPQSLLDRVRELDLDPILAHELVHVRRHDALASRLQLIAQALWWFHPLIWFANREARRERERCCDEAVVAGLNYPPIRYAATLVTVAELAGTARRLAGVPAIGPLEITSQRLEHITRASQQFRKRMPLSYLLAAVLLGAAVLPGAEPAAKNPAITTTLSITGVCVDSNQKPLVGVDVFLLTEQLPRGQSVKVRETHTTNDGRFRFDDVAAPFDDWEHRGSLQYCVVGRKIGWATAFAFVRQDSKPGEDLSLKMLPPVSLKGRVTDREGKPLVGAAVLVQYAGRDNPIAGVHTARTDEQGRYEIADLAAWNAEDTKTFDPKTKMGTMVGNCRFPVTLAGYAKTYGVYNRLPATADVTLEREALIEGRVIDSVTGKPAANIHVSCQGIKEHGWAQVSTDDKGRYHIGGLVPDKYNVWPDAVDRTAVAIASLEAFDGKTSDARDLKLIEGSFLEGTLVDVESDKLISKTPEGRAINVAAYGPARPRPGAAVQSAIVDQNGHFRLRVAPGVNYPYVMQPEIWKRVQRRDEYEQGIQVAEGEVVQLEIRVLPAPPPKNPPMSVVRSALPVPEEREAAAAIQRLGGWYTLDDSKHVVEVNMVYHGSGRTRLQNTQFTDEALGYLPSFSKLRLIGLAWKQATDEGLKRLAGAHSLREIHIWKAADVTDAGIEGLRGLKDLEVVHVDNARLSDAALQILSTLPKVYDLSLQGNNFTDDGLAYLSGMKQLRSLSVGMSKSQITDAGAAHVAGLANLESLDLQRAQISDEGLKQLRGLSKLKSLWLSGGGDGPLAITDTGLDVIASFANLKEAGLVNTRVTDRGLQQLAQLKKLQRLFLGSPLVSDEAFEHLRAALPNADIHRSRP